MLRKQCGADAGRFWCGIRKMMDNDFKVLKLKTMLERLDNDDLPNKCVVLTADDAYQSMVKSAYPLLKKYQMP
jgi:peptidoglycan/xylan/chitin deacetylase (PgdA/CDA1 family)